VDVASHDANGRAEKVSGENSSVADAVERGGRTSGSAMGLRRTICAFLRAPIFVLRFLCLFRLSAPSSLASSLAASTTSRSARSFFEVSLTNDRFLPLLLSLFVSDAVSVCGRTTTDVFDTTTDVFDTTPDAAPGILVSVAI
jgi:hypothetical protein